MMCTLSDDKYKEGSSKIPPPKAVHEGTSKICKTSTVITDLPVDCLILIFQRLTDNRVDGNSFGLTCRQWFHIQNDNQYYLWCDFFHGPTRYLGFHNPKIFPTVLCQLLSRFQNLRELCLRRSSKITGFVPSKLPFFESKVQTLDLDECSEFPNNELSAIFARFPRLTLVSLASSQITDEGLEALAKCCPSLEEVDLYCCHLITDSGISLLIQSCHKLGSLYINSCSGITGIGFLGCPKTITELGASGCKLTLKGINAIVSGGGLEYLCLYKVRSLNAEAVVAISKGCPLLKSLDLTECKEVELEGWEAIGRNCKNLERLDVYGCRKLCDQGLEALCNGCNKLTKLFVDYGNCCSKSALELFKRKRPGVMSLINGMRDDE